ncbi:uncharacterized protein Shrm isoform X2 [Fopius arisanus]|uniref:Uncharacterized protein Shrm isoform X2 n=1 Tax=Fopius arisanus TaxID=64838 RepID=A0A9R1TTX2_9HYME|nr:PREDICTED: uncharacterized protein LOC105274075 isoform X2 [Fopius arisanus]
MTELQTSLSGYRGQDEASIHSNGDENIYSYTESSGFDSFTLVHDEREAQSPPPTPPVRDASSLKSVCYGPGHEKYPSWPSIRDSEEKTAGCNVALGSHRSKSWTDHTNYPKEKLVQYTRPLTKRPTPTFTQQLKTVMEKCEKIPAESFEPRKNFSNNQQRELRVWPRVDREGKAYGDNGYVVPSPPEREQHQPLQTLTHADFEAYIRNYPESQIDCYGATLPQEGLDDFTRVEHNHQPSYAQSEGYHSYVSSLDSTTNTPFLDRLRRDSEAVAHRPNLSTWEDISHEGRDSVVTTSSGGSASSSETLKWHGSLSDVSVSSGLQARRLSSENWPHSSLSDVNSVNETIKKLTNDCKCQSSKNNHNGKSAKVIGNECLSGIISQCTFVSNGVCQMTSMSKDDCTDERYFNKRETNSLMRKTSVLNSSLNEHKEDWGVIDDATDIDQANVTVHGSKQLIAHSSRVQTPQRHHSESILYLDKKRGQRKVHSASSPSSVHSNQTISAISPQQNHLSVSERVDELEKQQIRYTYLDPDKRHRVSDPTLKAIQKKALLSFYERHHQSSWRSEPQLVQGVPQVQHSPPQPPFRSKLSSPRRASSASDYANSNWRSKNSKSSNNHHHQTNQKSNTSDSLSPKHKHSNSCGSLSTALLGPVIVGTAISIDDWVPERPPKKPHLRSLYTDRIPSPDLPPPSPPPVTDNEVFNCDEPLPPPPAELHDGILDLCKTNSLYQDHNVNGSNTIRRMKYERTLVPNNEGFPHVSLRGSSFRYSSARCGTEMNNIKLSTKISDISEQYGGEGCHERGGPRRSLRSWGINQISTGRHDSGTLTLGQKPQPQVSRNHSLSISRQASKPGNKFPESNCKSSEDRASSKKSSKNSYPDNKTYKNSVVPGHGHEWPTYPKRDNPFVRQINCNALQYQTLDRHTDHDGVLTGRMNGSIISSVNSTSDKNNMNIIMTNDNTQRDNKMERNNHWEGDENHSVMTPIEITEDSRPAQKVTIEMTPSKVECEVSNNACSNNHHSTAGSVGEVESVENTNDENINVNSSSLSAVPLEYAELHDNNNRDRSITSKSFSSPGPNETIDYDDLFVNNHDNSSHGNNSESALPENSQSDGSSQRLNSWTKSESRSPLLSSNLTMSDLSYSSISSQCSRIEFSPCVSPQPGIEELRLLQRTEVILRINATLDAASQTEVIEAVEPGDNNSERVIPEMRKKLPEEIECEELSKNLVNQLAPHDKLVPILVPTPNHKRSTDYVSDLFRVQAAINPRLKSSECYSPGTDAEGDEEHQYSHQMMDGEAARMSELSLSDTSTESDDQRQKKEELVLRLDRKVVVLRAEQEAVREEDETNEALGAKVTTRISAVARPAEIAKFRLHIEEVGKITSLLLGLSGRLARVENALHGMSPDHPEKKILESKRDKLLEQLEEAKILKINIDKRSSNVSAILSKYLNDEEFADYQHFINMKTKLIMDSRELQDKVKLGEEQLSALKEAIG